ncbi:MAG: pilus assembly protein TadG-related protein [Actinomycetia bacterium]|nr:pilus assembly protein TadG-related protein [Actinomycetes bacterium]
MRVQQLTTGHQRDQGAIAIVVAICAVLLFGMAAFAVDFGNVFANKRQLSVAADASALAAARAVNAKIPVGGSCNPASLQATADSAARSANSENDLRGDSVVTSVEVACTPEGIVEVTVKNQRSVETFFGGIFGANGYVPNTSATAQLYVPAGVSGLRPIAACQATVLNNYKPGETPPVANAFLVNVSNDSAICGAGAPGQWGFTNFLDQGSFGTYNDAGAPAYNPNETCTPGSPSSGGNAGCQSSWTADGYGGPVYFPNPALGGNTGLANSSTWRASFDDLVNKTILLPVADRYTDGPGIDRLNVTGVVAVVVCSANRGGSVVQGTLPPECSGRWLPPPGSLDLATWTGYKNNEGGLWVVPVSYATSGVVDPRAGCRIGDPKCDFGTRAVRLYR